MKVRIAEALLLVVTVTIVVGCNLIEVNMVQRSTMAEGKGITSTQQDTSLDEEQNNMELIVPLR